MQKINNGTTKGLHQLRESRMKWAFLICLILLISVRVSAQSKPEQTGKTVGILDGSPNIMPQYMQSAAAVNDVIDVRLLPRKISTATRIEAIEGAELQRNYAVTMAYIKGDSGKPVMKNGKFSTTAALGQYLVAIDSITHGTKAGEAGMYGFYRLPPMAPYVNATQGDYADRVEVSWVFDPLSPPANIDFFELKRDGEVIASIPVTDVLYKDYNTRPGTYYNYELTGKNKYGVGAIGNSVGFVNPNGVITGRILTKGGAPVRDVEVLMTPNLGKSLYFNGLNTTVSVGNKLNLKDTSFTIEFWMKHNVGDGGVFASGVVGNDVSIDMTNGRMWFDLGTATPSIAHQPDGLWHHYACVWNNVTKQAIIYKDSTVALTSQLASNHRIDITGVAAFLGKTLYSNALFNGNLDEIRIWRGALDQGSVLRNMYRSVSPQTANLEAYWRMDEGKGSKVFDYASKKHSGSVVGNVAFQDDRAPIRNTTFTNNSGVFIAEGINYGSSTNFTIYPSRPGRAFLPENRLVTLSTSNTAANDVNFTDISQLPVSGFIYHNNTTCLNDTTVELLVDDSSWAPKTYANKDGKFIIEFPPGSSHRIKPYKKGFTFTPAYYDVDSIRGAINISAPFYQMNTKTLTVKVAGGDCEYPIGGTTMVKLSSMPGGCYTNTKAITDGQNSVSFTGLPPFLYKIEAIRTDNIVFEADSINLGDTSYATQNSITKMMIYHSPLIVRIDTSFLPVLGTCSPGKVVLEQLKRYKVRYQVGEQYGSNFCGIDSATISVVNDIGDAQPYTTGLTDSLGWVTDTIQAGFPNVTSGGNHPYQKSLGLTAKTLTNIQAQTEFWAIVTGIRFRGGQTFVSRSPDIPFLILRQPPGDQSFSWWAQENSIETSLEISTRSELGGGVEFFTSLAPKFTADAGTPFFSVETEVEPIAQISGHFNAASGNSRVKTLRQRWTSSETITTNSSEMMLNEGDVFVGAAYNFVFGKTNTLTFNATNCSVVVDTGIISAPDSILTKFIYSEHFVRNTLIPNLQFHAANYHQSDSIAVRMKDSVAINNWVRLMAYNDSLKAKALSDSSASNVSFSAGPSITQTRSYTRDTVQFFVTEQYMEGGGAITLGLFGNGAGGQVGGTLNYYTGSGTSKPDQNWDSSQTTETGFTLQDDDLGDFFSVKVAKDKKYNTPVFKLIAGASSCPWEPGSMTRDSAATQPSQLTKVNVHPDSVASFILEIANLGSTSEPRNYNLSIAHETNPLGLNIAINGVIPENMIPITMPPGTWLPLLVTAWRSPNSQYDYSGIEISLEPQCEPDPMHSGVYQLAMSSFLNVNFLKPCTPARFSLPDPGFVINTNNRDTMTVAITGYDYSAASTLSQIKLQYRPSVLSPNAPVIYPEFLANNIVKDGKVRHLNLIGMPGRPVQKDEKIGMRIRQLTEEESYKMRMEYAARIPKKYHMLPDATMQAKNIASARATVQKVKAKAAVDEEGAITSENVITNDGSENTEASWFTFKTLNKADVLDSISKMVPWIVTGINDGRYDLRAVTICDGTTLEGTSALLTGIIDNTAPMVQGQPMPLNGILTGNDQIAVTFTKQIQSYGLTQLNNVQLYYSSGPQSGQRIDINFTCDGRSIVITPNIADRLIENQTLMAVVKRIKDLNGNSMRVPFGTGYVDSLSWEFVVQKSPVRWSGGDISIVKYADETVQVTRQLVNSSGFPTNYYIRNNPTWLGVSSLQGQVPNQGNIPITFTFNSSLASGLYEATVTDSTVYGDQPMRIQLINACRPPMWSVDPSGFQYSMNIIGSLIIDGTPAMDVHDKIGVFVGNQLRGAAELQRQTDGQYRAFLTVYSNQESGEQLQLRVWDSSACNEIGQVIESYTFLANSVIGTYNSPAPITATNQSLQQYKLPVGWTWLSFNTKSADMSVSKVLAGLHSNNGDIIKTQGPYAQYVGNNTWFGSLDTIRNTRMYLMKIGRADTLNRIGTPASVTSNPITVQTGWNYVGYLPQSPMSVQAALASLSNKVNGDIIKSQFTFAIYDQTVGWVGNMFSMQPKLGYLLKVANPGTLTYPAGTENTVTPLLAESEAQRAIEGQPDWSVSVNNYQYSMSVIATLEGGILDSINANTAVGLFSGSECRGYTVPVYDANKKAYVFYLTVYANKPVDDSLMFRVYDAKGNRTLAMMNGLRFTADNIVGTYAQPHIITGSPLEVRNGKLLPNEFALMQNYPNPFNPSTIISYALPEATEVEISIYNVVGEKILTLVSEFKQAGVYSATWNGKNAYSETVSSGIYIYQMKAGNYQSTKKLTFLK